MYYLKYPISGYVERLVESLFLDVLDLTRLLRSVFVDRTLEFVAKFACSFLEKEKKEGENGEADAGDQVDKTSLSLFNLILRLRRLRRSCPCSSIVSLPGCLTTMRLRGLMLD